MNTGRAVLSSASDDGGGRIQRIARRRAAEERADTPFVGERRQSRRPSGAIRSERSEQIKYSDARAAQERGGLGLDPRTDKELPWKPVFGCHFRDRAGAKSDLSEYFQPQRPGIEPKLVRIVSDPYGAISLPE
jgi:hypothetical protein